MANLVQMMQETTAPEQQDQLVFPPAEEMFKQAMALHRHGHPDSAEILYQEILAQEPLHFGATHFYGVMLCQKGQAQAGMTMIQRALAIKADDADAHANLAAACLQMGLTEQALASYDQALVLKPRFVSAHCGRGNVLRGLKRFEAAIASYDETLRLQPSHLEALNNRGIALRELKRHEEALASYDTMIKAGAATAELFNNRGTTLLDLNRPTEALASFDHALQIKPGFAEALNNRGIALRNLQRPAESLLAYNAALSLEPGYADALINRAAALQELGRNEEAVVEFRKARENGGESEIIQYHLAALGAVAIPPIAPAQFISNLFDEYAERFDRHLVDELQYRAPALLLETIAKVASLNSTDVVDLGCGTGLCGPLLRPAARSLCGVDLSRNMLGKARQLNIYDHLVCDEIATFLLNHGDSFDLAIATDVFIYIGDLSQVFQGARKALRAGGLLGFSIEISSDADFMLTSHLRYAHSIAYIRRLGEDHGFALERMDHGIIRKEQGADVPGKLMVMRRVE